MSAKIGVAIMVALLLLYSVLVAQRAWALLISGEPIGIAMGVSLVILPILAVWAIIRELQFGAAAGRLGDRLYQEGGFAEDVDLRPSGRAVRADADAAFPAYREAVQSDPDNWRDWYRLGLAYDGAGDRRRARGAIRTAIKLARRENR